MKLYYRLIIIIFLRRKTPVWSLVNAKTERNWRILPFFLFTFQIEERKEEYNLKGENEDTWRLLGEESWPHLVQNLRCWG